MNKKDDKAVRNSLILIFQLSLQMTIPILLCTFIAIFIQRWIDNKGLIIIGILVGIVAGINGVFRMVRSYMKDEESPGQRARRLEEEAMNERSNKLD